MNFLPPDFSPAYSEIFILVMVCVVMLADLAAGEKTLHSLLVDPTYFNRVCFSDLYIIIRRDNIYLFGNVCR